MAITQFVNIYQSLSKNNLDSLTLIYDENITFVDPIHTICGLPSLTEYFVHLYENLISSQFHMEHTYQCDNDAFLYWTMVITHKKLNKGKPVSVKGHSKLTFKNDKVIYHRDYFDLGEMLYEQLPGIGFLIKKVKVRAGDA